MNNSIAEAEKLIDFIYDSPNAYHAVDSIRKILSAEGFKQLREEERWEIKKGGKYFVIRNGSALVAFKAGTGSLAEHGFKIIGAHNDSPGFRIKPNPEIDVDKSYLKLNTEVYGSPIINTWMDRPLSIAGRVALKSKDVMHPKIRLVNINKPLFLIPNLAIHMNRDVNKGVELNRQKDILPVLTMTGGNFESKDIIKKLLAEELNIPVDDIMDFDLYLYEYQKGCIAGLNNDFISSGRLDDLSMVYAGITALTRAADSKCTNVMVCFDNEEVGNNTRQGASSNMLTSILERIAISMGTDREDYLRAQAVSFLISCDLGHALHPNYPEKTDPVNRPVINRGPVIKISAAQSYTTDAVSGAVYEAICSNCKIPVQKFVNRSDERGGSTIGPAASSSLNILSMDMGIPVLAMHSIRELAGVEDYNYALQSFVQYYNT